MRRRKEKMNNRHKWWVFFVFVLTSCPKYYDKNHTESDISRFQTDKT